MRSATVQQNTPIFMSIESRGYRTKQKEGLGHITFFNNLALSDLEHNGEVISKSIILVIDCFSARFMIQWWFIFLLLFLEFLSLWCPSVCLSVKSLYLRNAYIELKFKVNKKLKVKIYIHIIPWQYLISPFT